MKKLVESFNNAIEGFIYVLKTQRNMRIHFLLSFFVLLLGVYMDLTFTEGIILCAIVALVLIAEMMNTAIELMIDLTKDTYHPLARMAKDVSAGAVLIAALNAVVIGYLLFSKHIPFHTEGVILKIKQSHWYVTLLILVIVMTLTVLTKILFRKGTPLKGGMPSGHAALSFAIWTIIAFSTPNALMILLTLIMAVLVAKSRISLGIHTAWEVISGCILGIFATTLIFQLLNL